MSRKPMNYYVSDFHFSHNAVLNFERGQKFETIQQHDKFLVDLCTSWAKKMAEGSTLWFLGDFGNPEYLWVFNLFKAQNIEVNFIRGNHDGDEHRALMPQYVDNFYEYPQYISHKLVLGHHPQNVWGDQICCHGHLHSAVLDSPNFINANIHVHHYTPVTDKEIQSRFSKIDRYTRKFLEEPYISMYRFTQEKKDCIYDTQGRIDLSASRMLQKILRDKKNFSWQN